MTLVPLAPLDAKPESLTQLVLDAVQEAIVSKQLAPGTRVSEAMLAALLGVSKTPVREALLRLRHVGLVQLTDRGLSVVTPSLDSIRDAYELRASLERTAAYYAANRRAESEGDVLIELATASVTAAETGDGAAFRDFDSRFHRLVAVASCNPSLLAAIDNARLLTSALRLRDVPHSGDSVVCAKEHLHIAKAVASGDPLEAADAMAAHIHHVMSTLVYSLAAAEDPLGAGVQR